MFASHMAEPEASGADVLGIGALLRQAHACSDTHAQKHTIRGVRQLLALFKERQTYERIISQCHTTNGFMIYSELLVSF